jgi:hypothetical protein
VSPDPIPVGIDFGPVRPLGKSENYDSTFGQLEQELQPAIARGLVKVISTYDRAQTEGVFSLGFFLPNGGYPLDPRVVLHLYGTACQQQDLLESVLDEHILANLSTPEKAAAMAQWALADDAQFGLPMLNRALSDERFREPLTYVARSRIATAIKMIGYCEAKSVVPVFGAPGYRTLASKLLANTSALVKDFGHETRDPFWAQLDTVLSAAHREFIDETVLAGLSVEEVIRLRTKAWGEQARGREELFESIQRIAEDSSPGKDKAARDKAVADAIKEYRKTAESLERERAQLLCKIGTDLTGALTVETVAGALTQLHSPFGAAMTAFAGIAWGARALLKVAPEFAEWRRKRDQFQRTPGASLVNYYSKLGMGPDS